MNKRERVEKFVGLEGSSSEYLSTHAVKKINSNSASSKVKARRRKIRFSPRGSETLIAVKFAVCLRLFINKVGRNAGRHCSPRGHARGHRLARLAWPAPS